MSINVDDLITDSNDHTEAINLAIQMSADHVVRFTGGKTYYISDEIRPNRGTRLVCDGWTLIKALPSFDFGGSNDRAMIHQYRDGLPVLYGEPGPTDRIYLKNINLDGSNIPGANGILASLQQPAAWQNVRVDHCPGYGIALCDTVQAVFHNLMVIDCGVGVRMRSAQLCYFYGFNVEQSAVSHLIMEKQNNSTSNNVYNSFVGVHLEGLYGQVAIDHQSGGANIWMNTYMAMTQNQICWRFASIGGAEPRAPIYTIISAGFSGSLDTITAIKDIDRDLCLNVHDHFRGFIPFFVAPNQNYANPPDWTAQNGVNVAKLTELIRI